MRRADDSDQATSGDDPGAPGRGDPPPARGRTSKAPARRILLIGGVLAIALAVAAVGTSLIGGPETASQPARTAPATSSPAGGAGASDTEDGTPGADSGQGEQGEQDSTDASTPTPRPAIDADLALDAAVAGDATAVAQAGNSVLSAQAEAFEDPASRPDLAGVLAGPALAEYETSLTQLAAEGLRQHGAATIESVEVVEASGERAVAQVCVDSSQVRVMTVDGVDVTTPGRPERSAMVVTFLSGDGGWRLHESRFADDPAC